MTLGAEEFTNPALPGLIGITWGGQSFTAFTDRAAAEAAVARDTHGLDYRVVERKDGKFLVACVDAEDGTFFYVLAAGIQ